MQRGIATFTLDYGKCPPWLFEKMKNLGREMARVIVMEYGPDEFIKRLADPVWFQSLGTVLAFDWNASGLTTILTAALKEALRGEEERLGVFICGGKGKTSRKTPEQIQSWGENLNLPANQISNLVYNSKMAAKVDSSLVQDGFQIYHHSFFFTKSGAWTVVQQGMNTVSSNRAEISLVFRKRQRFGLRASFRHKFGVESADDEFSGSTKPQYATNKHGFGSKRLRNPDERYRAFAPPFFGIA